MYKYNFFLSEYFLWGFNQGGTANLFTKHVYILKMYIFNKNFFGKIVFSIFFFF